MFMVLYLFNASYSQRNYTHNNLSLDISINPPSCVSLNFQSSFSSVLIALDIYRRQARNLAWYDEEGEPSTHNPFKKFRRPLRSTTAHVEEGRRTRSLGDISEDRRRRQDMNHDIGGPQHSETMPTEPSGSEIDAPNTNRSPPESSVQSGGPINASTGLDQAADSGVPRQRKGFFGKFRRHEDSVVDEKKSLSEPQHFTLGSQLRATLLNSWINVLLVAAPVGSKDTPSH